MARAWPRHCVRDVGLAAVGLALLSVRDVAAENLLDLGRDLWLQRVHGHEPLQDVLLQLALVEVELHQPLATSAPATQALSGQVFRNLHLPAAKSVLDGGKHP